MKSSQELLELEKPFEENYERFILTKVHLLNHHNKLERSRAEDLSSNHSHFGLRMSPWLALILLVTGLQSQPGIAASEQRPSMSRAVEMILEEVDELLSPILVRPKINIEISEDSKNDYSPGLALLSSTDRKSTLQHEYAHAWFSFNFEISPGVTFHTHLSQFGPKLQRLLEAEREQINKLGNGLLTPEEEAQLIEDHKKITALMKERDRLQKFEEFNELWADAIPSILNEDPDFMIPILLVEDENEEAINRVDHIGRKAHFFQRSFSGNPKYVIQDINAIALLGYDRYSSLNHARYFIGSFIHQEMSDSEKRHLINAIFKAMQATMVKINQMKKLSYQIPYNKLNEMLISELEMQTGEKSPIKVNPTINERYDRVPEKILEKIIIEGKKRLN